MKTLKGNLLSIVAALAIASSVAVAAPSETEMTAGQRGNEQVRKQLVTLPYYGVFDNLAFQREGGTVTLYGQVVRPTTRSSAESRVKNLKGVERVVNNIEVLPLSRFDDDIRLRSYRAVFNAGGLYRYALGANPDIHIIVNRGRVTLEGVVATQGDGNLAYIAARGVSGVFEVTNNLRIKGGNA